MADSGNIWAATLNTSQLAIAVAPLGTPLPTSATASLNAAFVDLGWVGEDGVVNAITRETTKHYAFGGEVVKTTQDRYSETLRFTLLESNADVLATVFGSDSVTESSGNITVEHESKMNERVSIVFDFIDGDNAGRIVVREGLVIEVGEISYVHTAPTAYELTVDVYRTAAGLAGAVKYLDYAGS